MEWTTNWGPVGGRTTCSMVKRTSMGGRVSSTLKVPFLELFLLLSSLNDPTLRCSAMIGANYRGSNVHIVIHLQNEHWRPSQFIRIIFSSWPREWYRTDFMYVHMLWKCLCLFLDIFVCCWYFMLVLIVWYWCWCISFEGRRSNAWVRFAFDNFWN